MFVSIFMFELIWLIPVERDLLAVHYRCDFINPILIFDCMEYSIFVLGSYLLSICVSLSWPALEIKEIKKRQIHQKVSNRHIDFGKYSLNVNFSRSLWSQKLKIRRPCHNYQNIGALYDQQENDPAHYELLENSKQYNFLTFF